MIRNATLADIPAIVERGAEFFEEAGWGDIAEYDPETMAATLANMVEGDGGIVLVAYEGDTLIGMAGGLVFPAYFNASHVTGQEIFWWVAPGHRSGVGRMLFDALEAGARAAGAHSFAMACLARARPEVTGKLYERSGYRASERTFIKLIGDAK